MVYVSINLGMMFFITWSSYEKVKVKLCLTLFTS